MHFLFLRNLIYGKINSKETILNNEVKNMEIRKADKEDVEQILEIFGQAQKSLKDRNVDQWQDGYPNINNAYEDIENGHAYVLVKDNQIAATVAISFGEDESYKKVYEGEWLTGGTNYAVIHRIAVKNEFKGLGLASKIFEFTEKLCKENGTKSIKIDTHKENFPMQSAIKKFGFNYCGIIYMFDGAERIAFEKVL